MIVGGGPMTLFLLGAMLPAFLQEAVRQTTDHDKRSRERDDEVAQSGKFVVCLRRSLGSPRASHA